jgi:hypothetical protein
MELLYRRGPPGVSRRASLPSRPSIRACAALFAALGKHRVALKHKVETRVIEAVKLAVKEERAAWVRRHHGSEHIALRRVVVAATRAAVLNIRNPQSPAPPSPP